MVGVPPRTAQKDGERLVSCAPSNGAHCRRIATGRRHSECQSITPGAQLHAIYITSPLTLPEIHYRLRRLPPSPPLEPARVSSKYKLVEARVDEQAQMSCEVEGEPPLTLAWLDKDGKPIDKNDKRFM